jgi:probable DNA repair protein
MAAILFDITPVRDALEHNRLLITANNRQRNQIMRAFNEHRAQHTQQTAWAQPRLLSWRQWTQQQWQALLLGTAKVQGVIINPWQTQVLWERVIGDSETGTLLRQRELANTAESARANLETWRCSDSQLRAASQYHPNSMTFIRWLDAYRKALQQLQLVTPEQAQELLAQAFSQGKLTPEQDALLYGFDDIPPLGAHLMQCALPEATHVSPQRYTKASAVRTQLTDSNSEARAAALWADGILRESPDAVIGIIAPELGQQRNIIERAFNEVFEPLACQPGRACTVAPFNFSSGTPLGGGAVIRSALDWLELTLQAQPLERVCRLLHNPFWADSDSEREPRAALIKRLRRSGCQRVSGADLRYHAEQLSKAQPHSEDEAPSAVSSLSRRLQVASEIERQRHHKHSLAQWLDRALEYLEQLGWPGTRRLNSIEYQQIKQWYQLHEQLLSTSQVQPLLTLYEVTDLLRRSADKTHFQAQTPDSPIQILGALEASGLNFTHCWVLGMNHRAWPAAANPNPLLPISLQRELNMPNASAARELAYAAQLTDNFRHCAAQVVFSYASHSDEQPLKPSSLIAAVPEQPAASLRAEGESLTEQHYRLLTASSQLEAVDCRYGPPLINPVVRGGAGLFKAQSACPFMAFARYRLGASSPSEPVVGFSAIERGNALHEALAIIWQRLGTHSQLQSLAAPALQTMITEACSRAVGNTGTARGSEVGATYRQLEVERLARLLTSWLAVERERASFTPRDIETEHLLTFAGLQLTVRVDRIDQLDDGGLFIVDYKTGSVSARHWSPDTFSEPQLPLYACTLAPERTRGIAFAHISASQQCFIGTGNRTGIEGVAPLDDTQWQAQLEQWQDKLTELAQAFKAAWAVVDYRHPQGRRFDAEFEGLTRADEHADMTQWLHAQQRH